MYFFKKKIHTFCFLVIQQSGVNLLLLNYQKKKKNVCIFLNKIVEEGMIIRVGCRNAEARE